MVAFPLGNKKGRWFSPTAIKKGGPFESPVVAWLMLLGCLLLSKKPEAYTANDADKEKNANPNVHDCSPIFELMTRPSR